MKVELWSVEPHQLLRSLTTNSDGRTEPPLLSPNETVPGEYELIVHVGDYFGETKFLDRNLPARRRKEPDVFGEATGRYYFPDRRIIRGRAGHATSTACTASGRR